MPRANRYFIPGYAWHITHRCHKKEFLLRYAPDRQRWIRWLHEAKKRYHLEILNYVVTSNHIHILVYGGADREAIPRSMQLVAGRTAQEYNRRKGRKGAFWEDRYHATAVESGEHLARCFVYIDLNMVRAGVVEHPAKWAHGSHHEFLSPPPRYRLLPRERLKNLLFITEETLGTTYLGWLEEAMSALSSREAYWSENVAIGGKKYVEQIKEELQSRAIGRKVRKCLNSGETVLREPSGPYSTDFDHQISHLSHENGLLWKAFIE